MGRSTHSFSTEAGMMNFPPNFFFRKYIMCMKHESVSDISEEESHTIDCPENFAMRTNSEGKLKKRGGSCARIPIKIYVSHCADKDGLEPFSHLINFIK